MSWENRLLIFVHGVMWGAVIYAYTGNPYQPLVIYLGIVFMVAGVGIGIVDAIKDLIRKEREDG